MTSTEKKILDCWSRNLDPWVYAVQNDEIESRVAVTNQAIVDAVLACNPVTLLDIGCGEGWLIRALEAYGIICTGTDAISGFRKHVVDAGGKFLLLTHEEVNSQTIEQQFDVIVCNFSLLGKDSVNQVVAEARHLLNENGSLLIQTLHPDDFDNGKGDGWRDGSWDNFSEDFSDPAPWYFRTLKSWEKLLAEAGFSSIKVAEPGYPDTNGNRNTHRVSCLFSASFMK